MLRAQKAHGRTSLLKTAVLGVGRGKGLCVETADLDESGRLLSVGSADIFEMFTESDGNIENGTVDSHTARRCRTCTIWLQRTQLASEDQCRKIQKGLIIGPG